MELSQRERRFSVAIVAPFYNEEEGAEAFYASVVTALAAQEIELYLIFVDDGSKDRTLAVLNAIADRDSRVTVLSFARNFGHQLALTAGIDHANTDAVVTMDSDLQHPPEIIPQMLEEYRRGFDVVYGVRENDDTRGLLKQWVARGYYRILRRVAEINVIEGAVDFRLMSRNVVEALRQMRETHRYLRGMIPWLGFPYSTVVYHQQTRQAGKSSYSWKRLLKLAEAGFFSFSTFPLEVITWLGVATVGLALVYFLYIVAWVLVFRLASAPPGWVSTVAAILLGSGVQLISTGIIAKYIGMIFEQVKQRPLYVLKHKRLAESRALSDSTVVTSSPKGERT